MKVENLFHIILIFLVCVIGCTSQSPHQGNMDTVRIGLSSDSSAVEIYHMRPDVLDYLKSDSIGEKEWQSFFAVYPAPSDPELRDIQRPLPGSYKIRDATIVFVPEKKFAKDSLYFARCYSRKIMDEPSDLVMGKKLSAESEFVELDFKR